MSSQNRNRNNGFSDNKQEVVSITYEEIGLFPRSFSRVLDRFLKQIFSDVENLVIQEYRFYRYLFLTTFKSLCLLFLVPFFVNFLAKNYVIRPLTEYFWNTKQTEIFLNSYQQKRAFAELKDFEEKLYFESLIYPKSSFHPTKGAEHTSQTDILSSGSYPPPGSSNSSMVQSIGGLVPLTSSSAQSINEQSNFQASSSGFGTLGNTVNTLNDEAQGLNINSTYPGFTGLKTGKSETFTEGRVSISESDNKGASLRNPQTKVGLDGQLRQLSSAEGPLGSDQISQSKTRVANTTPILQSKASTTSNLMYPLYGDNQENWLGQSGNMAAETNVGANSPRTTSDEKTESLINSYTLKSSLFVYQTREADKNIQQRYQEKTIELAQRYNDQSIEAITNFFGDVVSLLTLFYLFYALEIQINITKSFLLEVFFGLDDSKKSLLILLVTDLLVGYHSSNLWELFFEFIFNHYGLPESQTGIFLLVATLPVLLDVLFKYLIFRHLNRSSPATVATYHAMIE